MNTHQVMGRVMGYAAKRKAAEEPFVNQRTDRQAEHLLLTYLLTLLVFMSVL
tara:strand:+ start:306 stop:461 length:156 start_codon:yes stop_codon:yes gene_type:complete